VNERLENAPVYCEAWNYVVRSIALARPRRDAILINARSGGHFVFKSRGVPDQKGASIAGKITQGLRNK